MRAPLVAELARRWRSAFASSYADESWSRIELQKVQGLDLSVIVPLPPLMMKTEMMNTESSLSAIARAPRDSLGRP